MFWDSFWALCACKDRYKFTFWFWDKIVSEWLQNIRKKKLKNKAEFYLRPNFKKKKNIYIYIYMYIYIYIYRQRILYTFSKLHPDHTRKFSWIPQVLSVSDENNQPKKNKKSKDGTYVVSIYIYIYIYVMYYTIFFFYGISRWLI